MAADLAAAAAADLADLLAVVERWAGRAVTDEDPTEAGGAPSPRVAGLQPVEPAPLSGPRIDVGRPWQDVSWWPHGPAAERIPGEPAASPGSAPGVPDPAGQRRAARPRDIEVPTDPTDDIAARVPVFGPDPRRASSASTHWSGRLPSVRPALHDAGRPRLPKDRAPKPESLAAATPTPAGVPSLSTPFSTPADGLDPAGNDQLRPVRSAPESRPLHFVRPVPVTTSFPIPVLVGSGAGTVATVEAAVGGGVPPSPPRADAAGSTAAARCPSASLPGGHEPVMAELIALERLGEAMADVIEAALLDAGVDLS